MNELLRTAERKLLLYEILSAIPLAFLFLATGFQIVIIVENINPLPYTLLCAGMVMISLFFQVCLYQRFLAFRRAFFEDRRAFYAEQLQHIRDLRS